MDCLREVPAEGPLAAGERDYEAQSCVRVGEAANLVIGKARGFSCVDDVDFANVRRGLETFQVFETGLPTFIPVSLDIVRKLGMLEQ